ncbi:zinc ribbon domain-containing protein [Edaphobacter paludis]|uniref:Zinc ribbon domain-containing protein n=1 Tax=Edaphobacter paludis TaxID=3035702 RepID=A0AAU7D8Q6_9BACT
MICQTCGNQVTAEVRFCPQCGAPVVVAAAPVPPPPIPPAYPPPYPPVYATRAPRVQRNLQMLGILWCAFGAYRIITGLIGIFIMRVITFRSFGDWGWGGPFHGAPWMVALLPLIAVVSVVTAFLAFLVGFSLLRRKPWGRVLGIVVAILALLKFPIGTALGIYTLWVLAPAESGMEYEAIADRT